MFPSLWSKCQGMERSYLMTGVRLLFEQMDTLFSKVGGLLPLPNTGVWNFSSVFPHPCQYLLWLIFLILSILTGMQWHLIGILIFIDLVTGILSIFSILYILWWSACSNLLKYFSSSQIRILLYSGYTFFVRYWICKCFLPIWGLSVHSLNIFFEKQYYLILIKPNYQCFIFGLCFWCCSK